MWAVFKGVLLFFFLLLCIAMIVADVFMILLSASTDQKLEDLFQEWEKKREKEDKAK